MAFRQFGVAASVTVALALATPAYAATEIQWWHAMTGGKQRHRQTSLPTIQRQPVRLQGRPHLQGQLSRHHECRHRRLPRRHRAAHHPGVRSRHRDHDERHRAIKPVYQLMKDANEPFDPKAYLPAITGYYSTSKGDMLSFPFNSSSTVMWINKDELKKAV